MNWLKRLFGWDESEPPVRNILSYRLSSPLWNPLSRQGQRTDSSIDTVEGVMQ
jgi:hypothetical protein